jgi:hypothetical protein
LAVLVRKVSPSRWKLEGGIEELDYIDYPSNSITNDIRISDGRLSVWKIDSVECISEVALALSCTFQKLDTITMFYIDYDQLAASGFEFDNEKSGDTPISDINHLHCDIINLKTVEDTCKLAKYFYEASLSKNIGVFTKKEVRSLIDDAIKRKRLNPNDLNKDLKKSFI